MIDTATKNRRFLGRWRKSTADTEQAIQTAMLEKKPSVAHQNQQPLPPRMQRDVSLMGGMFSTALGRRS